MKTKNDNDLVTKLIEIIETAKQKGEKVAMKKLYEIVMNQSMISEREVYRRFNPDDYCNGFYNRNVGTPIGNLELSVPGTRNNGFKSHLIPENYQRYNNEMINFIESLILNSYSPSKIARVLKLQGLPYSEEYIQQIADDIYERFILWNSRPIDDKYIAIYIDAYHCFIKKDNKSHKAVIYTVLGIDKNASKDVLAFYIFQSKESKETWITVFNNLIERGLKYPLIIITDDFPGIADVIKSLFPNSLHQLCLVHLKRNLKKNLSPSEFNAISKAIDNIKTLSPPYDEAIASLSNSINLIISSNKSYAKLLLSKIHLYLNFLHLPPDTQKFFYSTNPVESINSLLEKTRANSGFCFNSEKHLAINLFSIYLNLSPRWRNGVPILRYHIPHFNMLFLKFFNICMS